MVHMDQTYRIRMKAFMTLERAKHDPILGDIFSSDRRAVTLPPGLGLW